MKCYINPKGSRFRTISEFFFSVGWVVLTLENTFLFHTQSDMSGVTALGVRIFFSPMLFRKVFGNPCEILYYYFLRSPRMHKARSLLRLALMCEIVAVPVGVCISIQIWKLLATINPDYLAFMNKSMDPFLSVSPVGGFLIEATITFLMFLPGILVNPSFVFTVLETIFIMGLVYNFGVMTGAFMNPMAAASCLLMWHSRSMGISELVIHLFVYLLGPLIGTMLAVFVWRMKYSQRTRS